MVDGMSKGKRRHALPKRWFLGDVVKKVGAGRRVAGIHLRLVVFYSAGGVLPTTSPVFGSRFKSLLRWFF